MFYWFLKFLAIGPLLKLIFRPWAEGTENVPEEGPAILASNHLSYSDWLFMPVVIPRRVTFVAKAEYFETPGIKGWLQKKFFSGSGQVPIDRTSGSAAAGRHQDRSCGCSPTARSAASTRRARARTTASCTAAAPASPASRWRPACR